MFKQKNHTVTQSTLQSPCVQAADGFDSGLYVFVSVMCESLSDLICSVPVPDNQTSDFTVAQFTVPDTNPVWVYCRQANHCQQGMVFAINPGDKFDAFKSAATAGSASASSASVITVTATVTVNGATETTTYATTTGAASTTTSAPSASSSPNVVTVGANGVLAFSPDNLKVDVGETVTFRFMAKNHTVTQSSFANPCTPLGESSANGLAGFDSGL